MPRRAGQNSVSPRRSRTTPGITHSKGKIDRADTDGKHTQQQAWNHGYQLALAYNEVFAYILKRLDETEDVDGNSLLHNIHTHGYKELNQEPVDLT